MPRRFRKLRDQSRPAGCYYFANSRAWMQSELMIRILQTLNARMNNAGEYYPVCQQCSMPSKRTNQDQSGISPKEYNLKNTVPRCRSNQELEGEVQEEASPVCLQPDRMHQCLPKGK